MGLSQNRQVAKVPLHHFITGCGRTQEQSTFSTGFDEGLNLVINLALGQLDVAADGRVATVDHMHTPGRCRFNHQVITQIRINTIHPSREQFTTPVKVDDLQVAGDLAADDAHGIVPWPRVEFGRHW